MSALFVERWLPYGATALLGALWFWLLGRPFPADSTNLLLATGTTAAVLVGFVATVMAIILSITGSPVFRSLRKSGYHNDLFRYLFEAILWGMALLVLSILGFFAAESGASPIWFQAAWVVLASLTLFCFMRVFVIVFKLLRQA